MELTLKNKASLFMARPSNSSRTRSAGRLLRQRMLKLRVKQLAWIAVSVGK